MHAARVILAWVCGRWTTHFRVTEPSHGSLYVSPSLPFLPLASPFPLARPSRAVSRTHTLSLTLSTRRTWCFSASSDLNTSTTCHAIHVNIHTDTYIHIHNVCARASLCVLACVCIHPHTLSRSHVNAPSRAHTHNTHTSSMQSRGDKMRSHWNTPTPSTRKPASAHQQPARNAPTIQHTRAHTPYHT